MNETANKRKLIRRLFVYLAAALLVGGIYHALEHSWDRYQKRRQTLHQPPKVEFVTREYWPCGRLRHEFPVGDRQINGAMRSYDNNGTLRSIIPYRFGKRYGKAYYFDTNGNFQTMQYFRDNRALFPLSLLDCPLFEQSKSIDNGIYHV